MAISHPTDFTDHVSLRQFYSQFRGHLSLVPSQSQIEVQSDDPSLVNPLVELIRNVNSAQPVVLALLNQIASGGGVPPALVQQIQDNSTDIGNIQQNIVGLAGEDQRLRARVKSAEDNIVRLDDMTTRVRTALG